MQRQNAFLVDVLNNTTELGFKKLVWRTVVSFRAKTSLNSFSKHSAWLSCLIERLAGITVLKHQLRLLIKSKQYTRSSPKWYGYIAQERLHVVGSKRRGMRLQRNALTLKHRNEAPTYCLLFRRLPSLYWFFFPQILFQARITPSSQCPGKNKL